MADEDEEQATALAAPLLEDATEAPVNEAPEQSAAEAPEQTPEEPDEGRSTILGVGINLANAIVGSGIVGLPAALKDAGLGLGCLLLVGMAFTVHVVVVALVRDAELLKAAGEVTGVFSERSRQVNTLILNANDLVAVLNERRYAITSLLSSISAVSQQLTGVVADNEQELAPALERLNNVTRMLERNRDNLSKMLPGAAKYYLTQGEIVSNGAYYNALVPNVQPAQLLQPFLDYAFGFRRGVEAGQPPDNAGPRAELPFPVNGIPQPGDLPNDGNP